MNYVDLFRTVFAVLPRHARVQIVFTLITRVLLVALDLASLAFIGITVSLLTATGIAGYSITGRIIGWLTAQGFQNLYAVFAAIAFLFVVLKSVLAIALNNFAFRAISRIESEIAIRTFISLGQRSSHFFKKWGKKELTSGLLESMDYSFSKVISALNVAVGEIALVGGLLGFLTFVNPWLVLILIAYFGAIGFSMNRYISHRTQRAAVDLTESSLRTVEVVHNLHDNFKQIRVHGSQQFFIDAFSGSRTVVSRSNMLMSATSVLPRYFTEIALMLGFSLLILQRSVLGPYSLSPLTISLFVTASVRIVASMLPLQGALGVLAQAKGSGRLGLSLIGEVANEAHGTAPRALTEPLNSGLVDISNVSFKFDEASGNTLSDISLKVNDGEFVVLNGPSGGGKSTLLELILGLRNPSQGEVLVGGRNPQTVLGLPRGGMGYVPQRSQIINGTLRENIAFTQTISESIDRRVMEAIRGAGLQAWYSGLENGLETQIGELARNLSGGQIQRIAIARALFGEPRLLILDESTNALDATSEAQVLETLSEIKGKVTVIAVAHHGAINQLADTIVNINGGLLVTRPS